MSTPKFTPGPWKVDPDSISILCSGREESRYVAVCPIHLMAYREEQLPNAHLIAAAPEMYEALEECEEYFDQRADADHNGERYVPDAAMRLLTTVRAAIAKAEGRQP